MTREGNLNKNGKKISASDFQKVTCLLYVDISISICCMCPIIVYHF